MKKLHLIILLAMIAGTALDAQTAKEIIAIYKPPKVGGWRYYPESHNRKPCGCPCCQRGEPFSKKIQERYAEM